MPKSGAITRVKPVEATASTPLPPSTGRPRPVRTSVRDVAELRLHPPTPSTRRQQPHRGPLGCQRAPTRRPPGGTRACLLLCDKAPERFDRAALRWHGRYCREVADVSLPEAQAILATLAALPLPSVRPRAASALSDLLCRRGLERAGEVLNRWAAVGSARLERRRI
jgi:hypothetical protein